MFISYLGEDCAQVLTDFNVKQYATKLEFVFVFLFVIWVFR